jgi:hypothetical protein
LRCDAPGGGSGGCACAALAQAATASAAGINLRNSLRITVSFMEQSRSPTLTMESMKKRRNGV